MASCVFSINYLVRDREKRMRDGQVECPGGFEVDHQLVFGGSFYRKISRFFPLEDTIDVASGSSKQI